MTTDDLNMTVGERLRRLLQHLGIERGHWAARMAEDVEGLIASQPDAISSLTLVCPNAPLPAGIETVAGRSLLIHGDRGPGASTVPDARDRLPGAVELNLPDYFDVLWADVAADRSELIGDALLEVLARTEQERPAQAAASVPHTGEVAGITYRIAGSGPPLLLLPLSLAPSQWGPLLPRLGQHYTTITLAGPWLGIAALLESRGRSGYARVLRALLDEVEVKPSDVVLDVGCGTGLLSRTLARRTPCQIVALDHNGYLIQEAASLVEQEGVAARIDFREGSAEALPFADASFDVTLSVTVMEEVDADRMLAELVRVTKPGGRIGVIVRGVDMHSVVSVSLRPELKARLEAPRGPVAELGCADASLYGRFREAGLASVRKIPQLAAVELTDPWWPTIEAQITATLSAAEADEWRAAVGPAAMRDTWVVARPFHLAVGTKPLAP